MKIKAERTVQLHCGNPKCGYTGDITGEDASKYVNTKCPECGEIILTHADFKEAQEYLKLAESLFSFEPLTPAKANEAEAHLTYGKNGVNFWIEMPIGNHDMRRREDDH